MRINRNNYEAWFLDYFEGRLSAEASAELFLFLRDNSDLEPEFESFENIALSPEKQIVFPGKEMLKKNELVAVGDINKDNYQEYLLSEIEGLLSAGEKENLEKFSELNPVVLKERKLYSFTRLEPNNSIVFESKNRIKHKAIPYLSLNEDNYEERMIAEIEGILTFGEADELHEFLALNPHLEGEHRLTALTRLSPSYEIKFPDREVLKKRVMVPLKGQVRRFVYITLSSAAAMVIFMGLFFILFRSAPPIQQAANKPTAPQEKIQSLPINSGSNLNNPIAVAKERINNPLTGSVYKGEKSLNTPASPQDNPGMNKGAIPPVANRNDLLASNDPTIAKMAPINTGEIALDNNADFENQFYTLSQNQAMQNEMLLNDIWLAQSVQFAELNTPDPNPGKTLLHAITSGVADKYAEDQRSPEKRAPQHKFSKWTVAQVMVKTYNSLTHRNVTLDLQKDEDGKVISYAFKSENVSIERPLAR